MVNLGIFYTVFTPDEMSATAHAFGVEAETGGAVEIEFIEVGTVPTADSRSRVRSVAGAVRKSENSRKELAADEISKALSVPAMAAKVSQVE